MSKKPVKRNKKYDPTLAKKAIIQGILNKAVSSFYIIGDKNHRPRSFNLQQIRLCLKGIDLSIAINQLIEFFYKREDVWYIIIDHFFRKNDVVEVIPVITTIENAFLNEVGDLTELLIKESKLAVLESYPDLMLEDHFFYGYYISYGDDLLINEIEDGIIETFLEITNQGNNVREETVICNAVSLQNAIDVLN